MSTTSTKRFNGIRIPPILSWENPYETGVLLAESLLIFVVFGSTFSLRVFLKLASTTVGLLSLAEWGSRAVSGQRKGLVSNYRPSRFLPLSDSLAQNLTNYVTSGVRRASSGIEQLVDAKNPFKGLQLAGALYAAYLLLGIFSLKTLVLLSIVSAFGLPPLYLQFKPEVDKFIEEFLERACKELKEVQQKIHKKAGPQLDQVKKVLGSRGGFPGGQNYNPVKEVPTAAAKPTEYTATSTASATSTTSARPNATTTAHATATATAPSAAVAATAARETAAAAAHNSASSSTTSAQIDEAFKNFDSVPTLVGNVPLDKERLDALRKQ